MVEIVYVVFVFVVFLKHRLVETNCYISKQGSAWLKSRLVLELKLRT